MSKSWTGNNSFDSSIYIGGSSGSTSHDGNTLDLHTADYGSITFQVANGSSAPSAGATVSPAWSPDNSDWYLTGEQFTAGIAASTTYYGRFDFPPSAGYVRLHYTAASGSINQTVVINAQSHVCNSF